jgi:hypothetical protein
VHRNNILVYIQQDATLHSLFYLETALHVSGGTITHHQERKQLYLQHLVFVTPSLLSAAIVEALELVRVRCGWRRHPQRTQTSSNSSTITADSNNSVTNTRCCRYSCMRSWWWVEVHPKHVEQFPDKINCLTLHLVGYILEYKSFIIVQFVETSVGFKES